MTKLEFDNFYNKAVEMLPVPSSNDKEFRFHFYNKLDSYYDLVVDNKTTLGFDDNKVKELKDIVKKIKDILRNEYNGLHSTAFASLNNLLGIDDEHDVASRLIIKRIPALSNKSFYRMRKMENRKNVPYKEMFHIPFDKRGIISTQRYSFPGYPCLYLGESIYACWEELGRPLMGESMVSRYVCESELRLVDLRTPRYKDWKDNIEKYVLFFPIIMACSFKVKSENDTFKPEYIIPQLIMEIIIKYNRKAKDDTYVHGVYYSSVNKNEDFKFGRDKLYNIAVPVIIPLPKERNRKYCEVLSGIFKLTVPTCEEFENGKRPLLPTIIKDETQASGDHIITDANERYRNSTYGLIEERLKDIDYFPLHSMDDKTESELEEKRKSVTGRKYKLISKQ